MCREYSLYLFPPFHKLTLYTVLKLKFRNKALNLLHLYLLVQSYLPCQTRNRLIHWEELDLSFKCSHQDPWKHYPHSELSWNQHTRLSSITINTFNCWYDYSETASIFQTSAAKKLQRWQYEEKTVSTHVSLYLCVQQITALFLWHMHTNSPSQH